MGPEDEQALCEQLEIALKIPIEELRENHTDETSFLQIGFIYEWRRRHYDDINIVWMGYDDAPAGARFPGYSFNRLGRDYTYLGQFQNYVMGEDDEGYTTIELDGPQHLIFFTDFLKYIKYITELYYFNYDRGRGINATNRAYFAWHTDTYKYQEVDEEGLVWDVTETERRYALHSSLREYQPFEWEYPSYYIKRTREAYVNHVGSIVRYRDEVMELFNPMARRSYDGLNYPLIYAGQLVGPAIWSPYAGMINSVKTAALNTVTPDQYDLLELTLLMDQGTGILNHLIRNKYQTLYNRERGATYGETFEAPPLPTRNNQ